MHYRDGAGRVRTETLELKAGRHQVLLGGMKTQSLAKEG